MPECTMTPDQCERVERKLDTILERVRDMELILAQPVKISQIVFGWKEMIILVSCFVIPSVVSYTAMKTSLDNHLKETEKAIYQNGIEKNEGR